jgi:hypothetical protein
VDEGVSYQVKAACNQSCRTYSGNRVILGAENSKTRNRLRPPESVRKTWSNREEQGLYAIFFFLSRFRKEFGEPIVFKVEIFFVRVK